MHLSKHKSRPFASERITGLPFGSRVRVKSTRVNGQRPFPKSNFFSRIRHGRRTLKSGPSPCSLSPPLSGDRLRNGDVLFVLPEISSFSASVSLLAFYLYQSLYSLSKILRSSIHSIVPGELFDCNIAAYSVDDFEILSDSYHRANLAILSHILLRTWSDLLQIVKMPDYF